MANTNSTSSIVIPRSTAVTAGRRQFQRYNARSANCSVVLGDRSTLARLIDISLGGAQVELPFHSRYYRGMPVKMLQIPDVGLFRIEVRWQSDRLMGLQFPENARHSNALHDYLERLAANDERDYTRALSGEQFY